MELRRRCTYNLTGIRQEVLQKQLAERDDISNYACYSYFAKNE
jgi:hypothetical protein